MSSQNIKYGLSILLAIIGFSANAQQDVELPGIVVEQNSKVKTGKVVYVQGASIKAPQATPQMSDANGKFKLIFADLPLGNVTRIDVDRNGYEVVNSKVLQAAAITGRKAPLEIVMCKLGLLYENQVVYYHIATDATREQYEKKIKILEQGGKNKDDLIARLQKEMNKEINSKEEAIKSLKEQYQLQFAQSQDIANKFVTVNLDDESETYQRAFEAFQSKDIDKAILLLDRVNMEERLATNTKELQMEESSGPGSQNVERRKQQIKQDVSQCMFKSRLHILKYEYQTARQTYLLALQYDSSNIDNLWEVASFLLNQKEDSLAKKYFGQLLSLTHTDYDKAVALADIGMAYKNIGGYEEAEKYFPGAIKILNQLYQKDPNAYRVTLTNVLTNFGSLYYEWEYFSIAENYYSEADKIYVQSYDSLNNTAIPDAESLIWYDILNNQCLIYYKYKNYYGAMRHSYFQAIPVLQRIIQKNPGLYTGRLARALYNQGLSNFYLKDYDHAGDDLSEGLSLIRNLAEKKPDQYAADLADILDGLGRLCFELNSYDKAEQFYIEALKILREITEKNSSDLYLSYLASTLNDLGLLYNELKNYAKAEELYTEALKIQRQLVEKKPPLYSADLAITLNGIGALYYHRHNYPKAGEYYSESLENYKKLAEKNPEIYSPDMAHVLNNLGRLNVELKKYDSAEQHYMEALKIQSQVIKKEKELTHSGKSDALVLYVSDLSKTLNGLELLYDYWPNRSKANQLYADAKKEYIDLSEKYKLKPYDSVIMLNNLGKFCYKLEIYSKAEQSFNNALEQFLALSKEDQNHSSGFDIVSTSVELLRVYQKELETTKDFSYRDKAIKLINKAGQWNENDPNSYSYSYNKRLINDFDSVFKNMTTKDLKVTTIYLENIEKKLNSISPADKDTLSVITTLEQIIQELEIKHKESPRNQKVNNLLSQAYGSVSWYYIFRKQFLKTVESAQRGLALDSTQTWIWSNLALGYLSQGRWPEAKEIYEKYKDFQVDFDRSYKDMFLDDLHAVREAGIIFPKMREAEAFLLR